ncbi:MAG: hypothetical protein QOI77_981 [Blastocatellia bacterium]|nr:hypothetical protein [Blastocatellia bacterium]
MKNRYRTGSGSDRNKDSTSAVHIALRVGRFVTNEISNRDDELSHCPGLYPLPVRTELYGVVSRSC